jgi:hypothetical protein
MCSTEGESTIEALSHVISNALKKLRQCKKQCKKRSLTFIDRKKFTLESLLIAARYFDSRDLFRQFQRNPLHGNQDRP